MSLREAVSTVKYFAYRQCRLAEFASAKITAVIAIFRKAVSEMGFILFEPCFTV